MKERTITYSATQQVHGQGETEKKHIPWLPSLFLEASAAVSIFSFRFVMQFGTPFSSHLFRNGSTRHNSARSSRASCETRTGGAFSPWRHGTGVDDIIGRVALQSGT